MGWMIEHYELDDPDFNHAFYDLLTHCEKLAEEHEVPTETRSDARNVGFRLTTQRLHLGSNMGYPDYKGIQFNGATADPTWFLHALSELKHLWYHVDEVNGGFMAIEIAANRNPRFVETMPNDEYRLVLDLEEGRFYAAVYLDDEEPGEELYQEEWLGTFEYDEDTGLWHRVEEEDDNGGDA